MKDGYELCGRFILTLSPAQINSRFSKRFGNKLKWFLYTASDIIALSKKVNSECKNRKDNDCLAFS